jgi:hypothetical protein
VKPPNTADERERRFVQYVLTLNKGQIAHFKLTRLNRIANFRHRLTELLNEMVEARAEDLAAGMLMEYAPDRPKRAEDLSENVARGRLPLRKRRVPVWINDRTVRPTTRKL